MRFLGHSGVAALLLSVANVRAIDLDVDDRTSILNASKTIVGNILHYYRGSSSEPEIPGLLPQPYYWWEAGLTFNVLLDYWAASRDDAVVQTIQDALYFQTGPDYNYMPPNQTKNLGNDDQSYWAFAAMTAAEVGFPARQGQPTWLQLAQNVFDSQAARWDTSTCGGGLRWQTFPFNSGYNYKQSQSNGNFMQLAARLMHFTGNATYGEWAVKSWQWAQDIGLIAFQDGSLSVFDGADDTLNCSQFNHIQWTSTLATYLNAITYLSNSSANASTASGAIDYATTSLQILDTVGTIFVANDTKVLYEAACEPNNNCNTDQLAMKGQLVSALANLRDAGPEVGDDSITSVLTNSAKGAAGQCSGGISGVDCGFHWTTSTWDQTWGVGQDLDALSAILALLPTPPIATAKTSPAAGNSTGSGVSTSTSGANGTTNGTATATNGTADGTGSGAPSATPSTGGASTLSVVSTAGLFLTLGSVFAFL